MLLVAGVLGLAGWTARSAAVASGVSERTSAPGLTEYEAFRGTVAKIKQRRNTWVFEVTMSVEQVYGAAKLRADKVHLVLPAKYTRNCGEQKRAKRPKRPGGFKPTFAVGEDVVVVGARLNATRYSVSQCLIGSAKNESLVASVIAQYGEPRAPRMPMGGEQDPLPAVSYFCADNDEPITADLKDAACLVADDDPALTRAAAPGAALVLAGLLGLVLARRLRRRR